MKNIGVICRKELGSYLTSPMAYIVTAIFLALSGTFFTTYLASTNYADTSIRGFLNAAQIGFPSGTSMLCTIWRDVWKEASA